MPALSNWRCIDGQMYCTGIADNVGGKSIMDKSGMRYT